jgi:DNA-binding response OmpR family regulator
VKRPYHKSKVILIVDDDAAFLEDIQSLLTEHGHTVITCADPEQTLICIEDYHPDLVILDLAMPSLTGEDLMRWIRQHHSHLPIMICSGVPELDTDELLKRGAAGVFQKPFSSEALFRAIDRAA